MTWKRGLLISSAHCDRVVDRLNRCRGDAILGGRMMDENLKVQMAYGLTCVAAFLFLAFLWCGT
jgi:hypothetical protein